MSLLKTNLNLNHILPKIYFQSVRHHLRYKIKEPFRKPIWQPIAPSKLYRIRKREELSEEEEKQRKHLDYTYKITMKTIKQFLENEFYLPTLKSNNVSIIDEESELQKAIEINNQENERIRKMREERLKKFKSELEDNLLMKKIKQDEENRICGKKFDELVLKEIERSKTYITNDNIDAKIEEALTHETNYDYAIDIDGRIFFDGNLHPYALRPNAVPETSSNTEEYKNFDQNKPLYLKSKKLY